MITIFTPFQVDPDKLETAKACIAAFVSEIEKNEPQTLIYRSYQDQNDPLRFIHFMQFQDAAAHERHRSSSYVQEFVKVLCPCCTVQPHFHQVELFAGSPEGTGLFHAIQIAARSEAIVPLVSTAAGLQRWWAADVTESEGAVDLGFFNRQTVYRLKAGPQEAHRAEWSAETGLEWSGTRLVFELHANGDNTLLRFTHAGWRSRTDFMISCNSTWGELMFRLKAEAEGHSVGPLFLRDRLADGAHGAG